MRPRGARYCLEIAKDLIGRDGPLRSVCAVRYAGSVGTHSNEASRSSGSIGRTRRFER